MRRAPPPAFALARITPPALRPRCITPEPLNVAPGLVGLPLAQPQRRALAMGVDVAVVGLLSGVSGLWLLAGLVLVVLQLRSRRGGGTGPALGPRQLVGWLGAGVIGLLALQEMGAQWKVWQAPATQTERAAADDDAEADPAAESAQGTRPPRAAAQAGPDAGRHAIPSATPHATPSAVPNAIPSAIPNAIPNAIVDVAPSAVPSAAFNPASDAPSAVTARPASGAAAAPIGDAQRIADLEAQLKAARRGQPPTLRKQFERMLDDIGLGLGWGVVYFSLLPAWWGGQTLGKKLLRLRVVELTGKPMTVMRCLKRYGGYAAGMATGGLGFAQLLWDPNRQAIQDKAAHTAVIDLRVPLAEPSAAPGRSDEPGG